MTNGNIKPIFVENAERLRAAAKKVDEKVAELELAVEELNNITLKIGAKTFDA